MPKNDDDPIVVDEFLGARLMDAFKLRGLRVQHIMIQFSPGELATATINIALTVGQMKALLEELNVPAENRR